MQLKNTNMVSLTNIEAIAESTFFMESSYSDPYIQVISPKVNQIYSSSPIKIDFKSFNYPILPTGQHLQYKVDSGSWVDWYTTDSILINNLTGGKHSVTLKLVDLYRNDLSYPYSSTTINFIVGLNSGLNFKAYLLDDSKSNISKKVIDVDIGNILMYDLYAPIDVQFILEDKPSIVIAQLGYNYLLSIISESLFSGPISNTANIFNIKFV